MTTAPCTWPLAYPCKDCDDEGCPSLAKLSVQQRRMVEQMATEYLWNNTNRVYGLCDVYIRPCASGCADDFGSTFWGSGPYPWAPGQHANGWYPAIIDGLWHTIGCACVSACSCAVDGPTTLTLPGPVAEITEVRVDGVVVPDTSYTLTYGRMLIRTDGEVWPACQDLTKAATEEGTFEIVYTRGVQVPMGGQVAGGLLACEFAKAMCQDKTCLLPQRLQTLTREGVTVGFMDQFEDLKEGGTGIWMIDQWVTSVNRPRAYSAVRSVDIPRSVGRATWPRT